MERTLIDTNVLIDYLKGREQARPYIETIPAPAISVISVIEVLAGATVLEEIEIRQFFATLEKIPLSEDVISHAISIRRFSIENSFKVKLPDAIICASAKANGRYLITRDLDLVRLDPFLIRAPYKI
jgi:predicted nucleic acid-binding protein